MLPDPEEYWPVGASYESPGRNFSLGKPGAGKRLIAVDAQRNAYLGAKHAAAGLWDQSAGAGRYRGLLEADLFAWLHNRAANDINAQVDDDRLRAFLASARTLDDLVSGLQEDVVFMRRDRVSVPAYRARAVYLHVSFASGWCPRCAIGRDFIEIHERVPRAGRFGETSRAGLAGLLYNENPIIRFVWGLTPTDALDRRKCPDPSSGHEAAPAAAWKGASSAWLRVERQAVARVDDLVSCFLIRVYRYQLASLPREIRDSIRSSVTSMSPEVRDYKGFGDDVDHILSLL